MLVVYIVRMLDFINYCLSLTEFSTISEMALNILLLLCTMYPCGLNTADSEIKTSISLENADDALPRSIKCSAKIYFSMLK